MPIESFRAEPGRLDAVAAATLGVPRADVQRAIAEGRVRVGGKPRPKSFRLSGGELVEADLRGGRELAPDRTPVDVRYEDPYLLVVSKPAGLEIGRASCRERGWGAGGGAGVK